MIKKKLKNTNNASAKKLPIGKIQENINRFFQENLTKPFSLKQMFKRLNIVDKFSKQEGFQFILDLVDQGLLIKLKNGSFRSKKEAKMMVGRLDHVNKRFGYIIVDGEENDIWVRTEDLGNAIDGDEVSVELKITKHGKKTEGIVTQVIKRKKKELVGRIEVMPRYAFVIADNKKIHTNIFVPLEKTQKAHHNDKVIVKIKEWHGGKLKSPVGVVRKILGKAGENEAEIHSIMAEFDLPFCFNDKVEKVAQQIDETISKEEIKARKDFRKTTTFTIDPLDAKDFDDAISLKKLKNDNYEIGVHIADVSHYVKSGSILNKEAVDRSTSVYLVDRTIPMLPEKLSNGVCSLRPNEDKLTFSVVFEITPEGQIKKCWFGKTIIHSDRRFTYEEVQERIESGEGDFSKEINILNNLAKIFKAQRFKNGAINFEKIEVRFNLDEKGKPLEIIPKERKDAHKLVEEFMLLANKSVAEFIYNKNKGQDTFVYRVHDTPNQEKLEAFQKFAQRFGHNLKIRQDNISNSLNQLMDDIHGKPEQNVLELLAIKSMPKAIYTTDTKGHFGLAFSHYTHFTSPIRRYPDVIVHRLLEHYLNGEKTLKKSEFQELCRHASEREKSATNAERYSIKFKQVEFMQSMEKQKFAGMITGITEWGVFVEITQNKCEGMVRISSIQDDFYEYDEKNYCLIGKQNKRIITLGDAVNVVIIKTDLDRRTIDLKFVEDGY